MESEVNLDDILGQFADRERKREEMNGSFFDYVKEIKDGKIVCSDGPSMRTSCPRCGKNDLLVQVRAYELRGKYMQEAFVIRHFNEKSACGPEVIYATESSEQD